MPIKTPITISVILTVILAIVIAILSQGFGIRRGNLTVPLG